VDPAHGADAGARVRGQIVVAKIEGVVTATPDSGGDKRTLHEGDVISDQYKVQTAVGALAILAFSNGATIDLSGDTVLDIQQFEQDPFSGTIKASDMKAEPSTSETRLNLVRGDLVTKVVHLNIDRGSEFVVNTAVGAAGIRGTTFRIIFRPAADGTATFSIVTSDGTVVFRGVTTGPVSIPKGHRISSTFTYTPPSTSYPDGTVTSPVVLSSTFATQTEISSIQAASLTIVESLTNLELETPAQAGASGQTGSQPVNPTVVSGSH
jgi:hypothetical protein